MSEEQKRLLEQQLWNIANTLRGKMNADEFRDYILGFIFYKYLSEKMHHYANELLEEEDGGGLDYLDLDESNPADADIVAAIAEDAIPDLGFKLKPSELFSAIAKRGQAADSADSDTASDNFILDDLSRILTNIERSTMGTESEDDFNQLFEDLDLTSSKLGKTEKQKNALVVKVLNHLDKIDFRLGDTEADVLGDAYEYLIGQFASGAGKKAGEFYTPQSVSTILARLVTADKQVLKSVYDPTCRRSILVVAGRQGSAERWAFLRAGTEPHHLQPGAHEHDSAQRQLP
ncbi:MAG: type I restriction-modification system subunit M N-terminal domain-containing protein [Thiothrix sp.]